MTKLPARYKRLSGSAAGGFGEVYFCEDRHLHRKVAIKFLHDPTEGRRLMDELRALLTLRSKHVVQVYDVVLLDEDEIGIVEEYIDGEDLWDNTTIRQSAEMLLKTLWQVAAGIADIHAAGLIHRDIKPNNMKIDAEGIVKIFDFGLARSEGPKAITTGFVGTRGFAAPELYTAGRAKFSQAVDTFAFGATAIFLCKGTLPKPLLSQPPAKEIEGAFGGVSLASDLIALLERCLANSVSDRPTMQEVRDALARHLLRDRHKALTQFNGSTSELNATRRKAKLELPGIGSIEITYDGLRFIITACDGEVFVNNSPGRLNVELPGSCVVSLGAATRSSSQRAFITFDVSNPEVVL